mgnify:CR=1 FL=1
MSKVRQHFNREIMLRFMGDKELSVFENRYNESLKRVGGSHFKPTEQEKELCRAWLKDLITTEEAANKMGCAKSTVTSRFAIIMKRGL